MAAAEAAVGPHPTKSAPDHRDFAGTPGAHPTKSAPDHRDFAGTPGALTPRPCRVLGRRPESQDTVTLRLETAGSWLPGQFDMLYAFGVGEVPISISGDPGRLDHLVHTVRAVGPVSAALCRLRRGSWVGIRGPFGSAWPVERARDHDVLVIGGGLGLAPLRPVVYALARDRRAYRRVSLLYGARTPDGLLYRQELQRWRSRGALEVLVSVDAALPGWDGNVGVVTGLLPRATFDPARTMALVCGPEVMMRFTIADLRRLGLPETAIWISMERNMQCAVGFCGHCQFGPSFVCKDGPVFRFDTVAPLFGRPEI